MALQYASETLKNNKDLVLKAIKNNIKSYKYANKNVFDNEIMIETLNGLNLNIINYK